MVTHVLRRASLPTLITFNNCNDNDNIISKIGRDGDTLYIFNNFNDSNNNNDNNNCNSRIHSLFTVGDFHFLTCIICLGKSPAIFNWLERLRKFEKASLHKCG